MVAKTFFLEYQEFIKNLSDETILQKYDKISLYVFADKRECSQKRLDDTNHLIESVAQPCAMIKG